MDDTRVFIIRAWVDGEVEVESHLTLKSLVFGDGQKQMGLRAYGRMLATYVMEGGEDVGSPDAIAFSFFDVNLEGGRSWCGMDTVPLFTLTTEEYLHIHRAYGEMTDTDEEILRMRSSTGAISWRELEDLSKMLGSLQLDMSDPDRQRVFTKLFREVLNFLGMSGNQWPVNEVYGRLPQ